MKYLFLLLILMGCGKPDTHIKTYYCADEDECALYCETLYPDDSFTRKQCYSNEINRLNGLFHKIFVE